MTVLLVRYGEIALKGGKRAHFEKQLKQNIVNNLKIQAEKVVRRRGQFTVEIEERECDQAVKVLERIFGITWFGVAETCENSIEEMKELAVKNAIKTIKRGQSFAIRAQRSIKSLPFTSREIEQEAGAAVVEATGARVDLDQPDKEISIIASQEGAYVITQKIWGVGGLPVGTGGRVLVLLSGGFDSIAAAYLISKRGAAIDYLHFHTFSDSGPVMKSKIKKTIDRLAVSTQAEYLYLSSYVPFELETLNLDWNYRRYETVAFRRVMARVGEKIAIRNNHSALVLGDCLGQVASQTLENMVMVDEAVKTPILRPVIGMDKVEIIHLVKKIGLYEMAIKEYKDCCSLLSNEPIKAAYKPIIEKMEKKINAHNIVNAMFKEAEKMTIR